MGQYNDGAAAKRMRPRFKLFQPTTMVVDRDMVRVHLLDLSASGALIHHRSPPPADAMVRLDCAGRMRIARVMWSDGTRFGVSFLLPLREDQVTAVLADRRAVVAAHATRVGAVA